MPSTHPSQADVAAAYRTLIAHETEPKEQDFYRTRLQRLEPATEPECELDCRSRVAAAGVGVYCPKCSAKCADTDLTTQLAIQQIEGEAAWWRSIDFDRNASRTFESMTGDSQQAVRTGVERVLAHLTAAGRLIPAGGMARRSVPRMLSRDRPRSLCLGSGFSRGSVLVTRVDIEHTKAKLDKAQIENGEVAADRKRYRMSIPANPDRDTDLIIGDALTAAEALVAAVERVQALHEPLKLFLLDDNGSLDYSKPFDTLCRGCTDPDIVNAWECDDGDPGDDYVQHPCPTIEALKAP